MNSILTARLSKVVVTGSALCLIGMACAQTTPQLAKDIPSLYSFTAFDIKGKEQKLSQYKGKVSLVVNVASKCGNTPQYDGLQKLYAKYKDQGLVILGFPCNQFGGQEPGSNADILEFCTETYNVTFPMFSKLEVKGANAHPIYRHLVYSTSNHDDIEWNFGKFLVDGEGKTIARFSPKTSPDDPKLVAAIEKALAANSQQSK